MGRRFAPLIGAERRTATAHQRGKAEIRAAYENLLSRYENPWLTNERRRIVQGNSAVWEGMTEGIHRKSGKAIKAPIVVIVEFDQAGLATSGHFYVDTGFIIRQSQGG